jgi:glucokinase
MNEFSIGVDLGGTNLRIAAVEDSGQILETITTETLVSRGRESVINDMCDAIKALAEKYLESKRLAGIGVGVPGIIDMETGMVRESPNLPDWYDYPVQQEIERRLVTPVILENDANVAALGEKWLGAGREVDSMCMYTLGTGVGGGIILNGKIWHGMTGMAGELGHMTYDPVGVVCGCTSIGCLEQYASATAIKRMAIAAIASGKATQLSAAQEEYTEITSRIVFDLAMKGDAPSQEIFNMLGRALGTNVAGMINALNLPMYVIGGGVSSGWEAFAPAMMDEIRKRSFVYRATSNGRRKTQIVPAVLGGDAGLLGAAKLAFLKVQELAPK